MIWTNKCLIKTLTEIVADGIDNFENEGVKSTMDFAINAAIDVLENVL